MQGINHVVFGSLVGLTIKQPALAAPIALASHFALDMIPHYGEHHVTQLGTKLYHVRILADIAACFIFGAALLMLRPANPGLVILCAILAVIPDFLWPIYLAIKPRGFLFEFFKFHKLIQRESPLGIIIEVVWFLVTGGLVVRLAML